MTISTILDITSHQKAALVINDAADALRGALAIVEEAPLETDIERVLDEAIDAIEEAIYHLVTTAHRHRYGDK